MEIIWRRGRATAQEVKDGMSDPPSYSAVRALLRLLEDKGHLRHEQDGRKYVFLPVVSSKKARRGALQNLVNTFFENSVEETVASLLDLRAEELTDEDFKRLRRLIDTARKNKGAKP